MALKSILRKLPRYPKDKYSIAKQVNLLGIDDMGYVFKDESYRAKCSVSTKGRRVSFLESIIRGDFVDCIYSSSLYQDYSVSLDVFIIPPRGILPLHDHPNMEVFQKIIYGEVSICEISCVSSTPYQTVGTVSWSAVSSKETECACFFKTRLFHEIRNLSRTTPAVFIDIISPPYGVPPSFIECNYYYASAVPRVNSHHYNGDSGLENHLQEGQKVRLVPRCYEPYMKSLTHMLF